MVDDVATGHVVDGDCQRADSRCSQCWAMAVARLTVACARLISRHSAPRDLYLHDANVALTVRCVSKKFPPLYSL